MMKWGRKKPASSVSSSRFPSLSHVLPASWSSMFKRMSINTTAKPAKQKSVEKLNAAHVTGSVNYGGVGDGGRFYRGDNDAFWRLSFHEENVDGRTSRRELKSVWYDSENELNLPSSCEICGSNMSRERGKVGTEKSSRAAWEAKLMNEIHRDAEIFAAKETYKKEKAMIIKTPRLMDEEYLTTKKSTKRVMGGKSFRIERNRGGAEGMPATSVEESALELKSSKAVPIIGMDNLKLQEECLRRQKQIPYENPTCSDSITTKEVNLFCGHKLPETDELQPQCLSSQRITLKDRKIKQLMEKSDKQRKSVHVGRELESRGTKQKSKVKVFSPRTVARTEICKVRALEDMKKAKLKTKAVEGRTRKDRTGLENFAMVKFSADPEKDFRDSMIEMIVEKGISQSEELEALLACYLTLNSDEYHDLIIKVFREVWTKLDEARFDIELLNQQYLHNFLLSSSK